MDQPDYQQLFNDYAAAYERSLGPRIDTQAIRAFFAESFIAAGTNGQVRSGANDDTFEAALQKGYAFYRSIGTKRMKVERVEAECLYENHDRVRVFYRAGYEKRDRSMVEIPFDVLYLVQRRPSGPKIFGFVSGDEMALFRQHGLVDERDEPT